jgi:hypothetical protein
VSTSAVVAPDLGLNPIPLLPIALHPSLRAEWFRKTVPIDRDPKKTAQAQDDAIRKVKMIVKVVAKHYQDELLAEASANTPQANMAPTPQPLGRTASSSSFLEEICDVPDVVPLAVPTMTPTEQLEDELSRYFTFEGGRGNLFDPLAWWKVCAISVSLLMQFLTLSISQAHCHRFPVLSRMARDYLAIPATSVSVKRTFSKSRRICTEMRSSLRARTIREALLTKLWARNGLISLV